FDSTTPSVFHPQCIKEQPMRTPSNPFLITKIACVLAVWGLAGSALAVDIVDDPAQIDERAAQIVQTANSLCWEMHRYHRQQPDYAQAYRTAKDVWARAGELRDALLARPVETEALMQQVTTMNENFRQLEQTLAKWGD